MNSLEHRPGFDEQTVRGLLTGDEQEAGLGLAQLDKGLRGPLGRWLERRFPGLSAEDRADVWADTVLGVLQAVREGRFSSDPPLLPWLLRIAGARATDYTRRRKTRENALATLARQTPSLRETRNGVPEQKANDELMTAIHGVVALLPDRQRVVLEAFVAHYPESTNGAVLHREVERRTGIALSRVAVKRALQEGRRKARMLLLRLGCAPEANLPY